MHLRVRYCNFHALPSQDGTTWQLNAGIAVLLYSIADEPSPTALLEKGGDDVFIRAFVDMSAMMDTDSLCLNASIIVYNRTDRLLKCDGITKLWNSQFQTLQEAKFVGPVPPRCQDSLTGFNVKMPCVVRSDTEFTGNVYLIIGLYPERPTTPPEPEFSLKNPALNRDFTDFTILVRESLEPSASSSSRPDQQLRSINVHRVILAVNSSVFATALETNMREKQDATMTIEGFPFDSVATLIDIFYSRDKFPETASFEEYYQLLMLADMYNVVDVREVCLRKLLDIVGPANVCSIVEASYLLDCARLKEVCWEIMSKNNKRRLAGWAELKRNNSEFACNLLEDVDDYVRSREQEDRDDDQPPELMDTVAGPSANQHSCQRRAEASGSTNDQPGYDARIPRLKGLAAVISHARQGLSDAEAGPSTSTAHARLRVHNSSFGLGCLLNSDALHQHK